MNSWKTVGAGIEGEHGKQGIARRPARSAAVRPGPAAASAKVKHWGNSAHVHSPLRVALVDDDLGVHDAMHRAFATAAPRWTLECHLSGTHALDRFQQAPPDAVLMGITMPDMTGIECTQIVKARLPRLPVIMHTVRADPQSFLRSILAGASGYLVKPGGDGSRAMK